MKFFDCLFKRKKLPPLSSDEVTWRQGIMGPPLLDDVRNMQPNDYLHVKLGDDRHYIISRLDDFRTLLDKAHMKFKGEDDVSKDQEAQQQCQRAQSIYEAGKPVCDREAAAAEDSGTKDRPSERESVVAEPDDHAADGSRRSTEGAGDTDFSLKP